MRVLQAVVHNQLMRLPPIRRLAQNRHRTGLQSDSARAQVVFEELSRHLPRDVSGLKILELGPGKGWSLAQIARSRGAMYGGFDVCRYLTQEQAGFFDLGYSIGDGDVLPFPDRMFDVVWSHSVLEHVRSPERLLAEVNRVLAAGGLFVSSIDLQSHYHDRRDASVMYDFLRYSERLWNLMADQRSIWVNRLRKTDWCTLFGNAGFQILLDEPRHVANDLSDFRKCRYLSSVSDEDLLVAGVLLVAAAAPVAPSR